jgi:sigma-B regulation protein RsbU (phosphoserine phosphatase)
MDRSKKLLWELRVHMNSMTIAGIPLFASLPVDEIKTLTGRLRSVELAPGTVFLREGDHGERFYVILEGRVEILKALGTTEERLLSHRGPGDFVGEMSLIGSDRLRTASVRSLTRVLLIEISRADFDALLHRYPAIAYELARVLSVSLRDANDATIRDLQNKNRELAEAYQDLRAAQAQIIEKEKLERELELAREIQESMLPRSLPHFQDFDLAARMIPARTVGGDFYDFIPLDDNRLGIAVGDVSDKGIPSALFMAMTRSLVRSEARRAGSPRAALEWVDRHLLEMNDAGMFVTVLYGVLDRTSRRFHYVRAGHVLPILCHADGTVITPPASLGQPLGVLPDASLDEHSILLPPNSTLVLYSDGIIDGTGIDGEFFGVQRLHKAIVDGRHDPVESLCGRILEAIHSHSGHAAPNDDVTLVIVRSIGQQNT